MVHWSGVMGHSSQAHWLLLAAFPKVCLMIQTYPEANLIPDTKCTGHAMYTKDKHFWPTHYIVIIITLDITRGPPHSPCPSFWWWSLGLSAGCPWPPVQSPPSPGRCGSPRPTCWTSSPASLLSPAGGSAASQGAKVIQDTNMWWASY